VLLDAYMNAARLARWYRWEVRRGFGCTLISGVYRPACAPWWNSPRTTSAI